MSLIITVLRGDEMLTDNMDLPLMSTPEKFKMIKHNIYTVLPILVMNLILKFGHEGLNIISPATVPQ